MHLRDQPKVNTPSQRRSVRPIRGIVKVDLKERTVPSETAQPAADTLTDHSPLLTTEQAAIRLQVSVRMMKTLLSNGRVTFVKVGRATRIEARDLDAFIAQNRQKQRRRLRDDCGPSS
jgi:excisionase family DNA binding protein